MTFREINFDPDDRELRIFSLLWLVGFGVLGGLAAWRGSVWAPALWGVAVAGAAIGLISPRTVKPVYVAWMVAAFPIGWAVSLALLALVYYLVFTPLAFVFRLAGRDALGRRFDRDADTYWVRRPPTPGVERYFRQF